MKKVIGRGVGRGKSKRPLRSGIAGTERLKMGVPIPSVLQL